MALQFLRLQNRDAMSVAEARSGPCNPRLSVATGHAKDATQGSKTRSLEKQRTTRSRNSRASGPSGPPELSIRRPFLQTSKGNRKSDIGRRGYCCSNCIAHSGIALRTQESERHRVEVSLYCLMKTPLPAQCFYSIFLCHRGICIQWDETEPLPAIICPSDIPVIGLAFYSAAL